MQGVVPDPDLVSEPNDYILRAAKGLQTPRIPVWVHRQAGRYLPEFRALRVEHDFFAICRNPELACEITLQPLRRIPYDAAIIFSDILVIPQALGMEVLMVKGKGPHFTSPLKIPEDAEAIIESHKDDINSVVGQLNYVFDAIRLTRAKLGGVVPLLGFSGAPWTLMAYMIEGGGSKTLSLAKRWLYCYPEVSRRLLRLLEDTVIEYLIQQVHAGAQMLEVFDTWAEFLAPDTFVDFVVPGLRRIASEVKAKTQNIPMTLFAKGANASLHIMKDLGYDVLSVDWTISPKQAREAVSGKVSLQGNLDPCVLYGPKETIEAEAKKMVDGFGSTQKVIANLGHGVYPDHNPDSLLTFVKTIQSYSGSINLKVDHPSA